MVASSSPLSPSSLLIPLLISMARFNPVVFSHSLSIKLDGDNFLLRHQQFQAAIRGHRLHRYIDEACAPPLIFLSPEDNAHGRLPALYDTFVVSVMSCLDDYTVAEIESLLLPQESRIEKHVKELDSNPGMVNLATQPPPPPSQKQFSSPYASSSQSFPNSARGYSGSPAFFSRGSPAFDRGYSGGTCGA
ncbi:hypothetical protein PanWU01x14_220640 [Parasponia andersonii]|uniref:Uncharacterized protein n=1 Tax=Parasponia andersonii TaxID=3476 RepID=A0A2P5BPT9_PARAD|nr:hypothetical protein PanWU01x14_220640 [Parasponia andersonii]